MFSSVFRPASGLPRLSLLALALTAVAGCSLFDRQGATVAETGDRDSAMPASDVHSTPAAKPATRPVARGSIRSDILVVNDGVVSASEVLYAARTDVAKARREKSGVELRDALIEILRRQTQTEVGTLLVYADAHAQLADQQKEALDTLVEREVERRIGVEFGGSKAAFVAHLQQYDLAPGAYKEQVRRRLVVQSYARERLMPQAFLRRDELLAYYRENQARFATPETRELFMMEMPFDRYLPEGQPWITASEAAKRRARLAAVRAARAAHADLASRPFEDVAREYSRGIKAAEGGAWGEIGQPLQPPYDEATQRVFTFSAGQVSEPMETPEGWCIVKCGQIKPAQQRSFAEAQDDIRRAMEDDRFNRLSTDAIIKLAENAQMSDLPTFLESVVLRAMNDPPAAGMAAR
jgi:parvulin-like peptidyl-prolyl isomerase